MADQHPEWDPDSKLRGPLACVPLSDSAPAQSPCFALQWLGPSAQQMAPGALVSLGLSPAVGWESGCPPGADMPTVQ